MSVDVEEYFMVEAFSDLVSRESWPQWPSRVVSSTQAILDLFDKYGVKATFFFVGWIAAKYPRLVQEVGERGHELACHSYWHRPVYGLGRGEFRRDTQNAVRAIEDASGVKVQGYRAPSWSITRDCLWALDILAEEGFSYDSSIFPIRHDLYGIPNARRFPYKHLSGNGRVLFEIPPATISVLGQNLPAAGGGYLRLFPFSYTRWVFKTFEQRYGESVVVYFHPWEIDPEQPRIAGRLRSRIRHYTNLQGMRSRLEQMSKSYSFQPLNAMFHAKEESQDLALVARGEASA